MADKVFGGVKMDANNRPVPAGNSFTTTDATTVPVVSPLAFSTVVLTLTVPTNAYSVDLYATTALRVSEIVGLTRYFVIPAGGSATLPLGNMSALYVVRDSADGNLSFRFNCL